ncbi:MAG: hypothetical protein DMF74_03695 [Acidobacteria bacterium]|nr:MAG: hypothetical protein DMF74_03695 [Acidobacteriota bacterium]
MKPKYEIAVIGTGALMLIVPYLFWNRAPKFVRDFFTATSAPVNLAVFRIVLFTLVLFSFSMGNVAWFGSLPPELRFPPTGLNFLISHIPITETVAWYAALALTLGCIACILGLFTRTSIIICLVLSIYVLGVPQVFGKINHYHHLIWFMAILAVSPCSDVLSIDAVRKSWRRADRGTTEPPTSCIAYALPLRFVWLLMGVIYFSAGVWKMWTSGYRWAWSDNPRNLMYNKWMELSGWMPVFRIDHHPLLFKVSALFTLAFELSFIFLIFFSAVRWLAPLGGLAFHNATNLFMRISFWNLQACYVAFVDWNRFLSWIGRRLFPKQMYLVYDGNCKLCRRTVASFRVFDLLNRVTYINALDRESLEKHQLTSLDSGALMRDMHVIVGSQTWKGFAAYREWMKRFPIFWFAVPFLYLGAVIQIGQRIYRQIADSRTCSIAKEPVTATVLKRRFTLPAAVVGSVLVYVAILSAVGKLQTWPMAGYPTFEDLDPPEVSVLTMVVDDQNGNRSEIRPVMRASLKQLSPERLMGLQNHLLGIANDHQRGARLEAFWKLWLRENPTFNDVTAVKFYRDTLSSLPEDRNHSPIRRELIAELQRKNGVATVTQNQFPQVSSKDDVK